MKRFAIILILLACTAVTPLYARVYAVCVGVDNYDYRDIPPLHYARSDARAVARFLTSTGGEVMFLDDKKATLANVSAALKQMAARTGQDDVMVFYFSGHGLKGGVCMRDTRSANTLLTYKQLGKLFKQTRARTKLIIVDSCHSGTGRIERNGDKRNGADTLKDTNIILFMASRGNEVAAESSGTAAGLFTRHMLDGMKGKADANRNGAVSARELFNYVSSRVQRDTRGRQHPVMWGKFNPELTIIRY